MFDTKNVDTKGLRMDLIKNTVIVVVSRMLKFYLVDNAGGKADGAQLFNQDFVYSLVFLLLAFVFFHVVVNPSLQN
jgi:hypothetical protein